MAAVSLTVNGKSVTADVDPRTLLVQLLRENLRLTGTHVGCDTSQCGACVVIVNGKAVKSCTVLAVQLDGADVLSIEGVAPADGPLHPMQEAFRENHGLQCGYCTPGMILTAIDMVRRRGHELDDRTIREELEGNICRCTGYHNIVKAIAAGARAIDLIGARLRLQAYGLSLIDGFLLIAWSCFCALILVALLRPSPLNYADLSSMQQVPTVRKGTNP